MDKSAETQEGIYLLSYSIFSIIINGQDKASARPVKISQAQALNISAREHQ